MDRGAFAQRVFTNYEQLQRAGRQRAGKSIVASHEGLRYERDERLPSPVTTGHPDFGDLPLGVSAFCEAVAIFVDLEQFTQRTFWDPPDEVVWLAQAVLTEVAKIVTDFGGFVLGLRGDGLFGCFGGVSSTPKYDAALALAMGAGIIDATQQVLNPILERNGMRPVQVRAGADFGRLDFVRTGTRDVSEINVVGFAANFAAKCEKYANSWEYVVGEGLRNLLPEAERLFTGHEDSPKRYTRDGYTKAYHFYKVNWRALLPELDLIPEQLAGNPSSKVRVE